MKAGILEVGTMQIGEMAVGTGSLGGKAITKTDTTDRIYPIWMSPTFDGEKENYADYKYNVTNLKSQCGIKDHKVLAPRLISNFKGAMSDDARNIELSAGGYQAPDGVERLLALIRKRLNIRDLDPETEAFDTYFNHMTRTRCETLNKYTNAEGTAYRKTTTCFERSHGRRN